MIFYILILLLLLYVAYRIIKPLPNLSTKENPDKVTLDIKRQFNAEEIKISLLKFDSFKSLTSPKIVKSLRITKNNYRLDIAFIEYTYVVPNKVRNTLRDDKSTYAFYLLNSNNFNISMFPKRLDTKEISGEFILVRFDREPINKDKTTKEINNILNSLKNYE